MLNTRIQIQGTTSRTRPGKKKGKKMKKIVLTLAAMMTMSMAFANTENIPENAPEVTEASTAANYDMTVNYSKLATTLELSSDQIDAVEAIHDQFINDMRKAANAEASERAELVKKAATKELKYMHYVLNEKQYRKCNTLLNLTLENRGLLK